MNIRNKLTVEDFIEVLKTFPQSWEISVGDSSGEEYYSIKGVFQSSESDFEMLILKCQATVMLLFR